MAESESCEALQIEKPQEVQLKDGIEEAEEEIGELEAKEAGGEEKTESEVREVGGVELLSEAEVKKPQSKTLAVVECTDNDRFAGMLESSTAELGEGSELKALTVVSPQEVTPISTIRCDEVKTQNPISSPVYIPTLPEGYPLGQKINGVSLKEANQQSYPPLRRVKTPITDGYNWRKYGQKQVKSPIGSRSYYKCTYSECHAKKVECSDDTGHIIEIVNKGLHSHDPPRKNSITRESRVVSSSGPVLGSGVTEESIRMPDNSEPSTSPKESNLCTKAMKLVPERKRQYLDCSDKNGETEVGEDHSREPEPKERTKKDKIASPGSEEQPGKKHKIVVHAAGDVGISGDGYRWRKYGQKMVKGNPHPRNYYRCTSAGCPVRKHIETAADNASAVTITYKGVHDHDMPVPKKRQGPPSAPLVAASAPAAMNMQPKKPDTTQNQITPTKWSVGTEGELTGEAMDLGGQKAIESAKTLLSIGFEIKPC